ncbi:MAG: prenyltransferase/squalene oxidase repeat-containing protein [Bythopirellula sp.]|nr:prenyltransferase/squalene oxidase repeat-containing protein [Bythopirellula sp.]
MQNSKYKSILTLVVCLVLCLFNTLHAAEYEPVADDVLTEAEWESVDKAVERGLAWLASQQQADGSFPTMPFGQPAVSSLCELAFLAHGHLPGEGEYGDQLSRAVDYVAARQQENGIIALVAPRGPTISRQVTHEVGTTASYNHAIASLALCENYSIGGAGVAKQLDPVINKALAATLAMQKWQKRRKVDEGGWRYLNITAEINEPLDSDLSVTGWQLMFLRSAKNAGFDVPQEPIDEAVVYVRRCFIPKYGSFLLFSSEADHRTRGMAGAGILALAHAGLHDAPETKQAGDWILKYSFTDYNVQEKFGKIGWVDDRYHYSAFNCCQAMYQLGGDYWRKFFPPLARTLVANQQPDGSWQRECQEDGQYGSTYTTALVLLSLGAPNQLIPIFQR